MGKISKLAGQTAIYGLPSILGRFLNYLLVFLHTNIFVTNSYGVQNYFYAIAAFVAVLFTYGMETAFFRYSTLEEQNKKVYSTAQISLLVSTLVLLTIIISFSSPIARLIGYENNSNYVIWFGLILSFDAFCTLPFAKLRVENKPFRFALIRFLNILINIFFNLFFLLLCPWMLEQEIAIWAIEWFYNPNWSVEYVFLANLLASATTLVVLSRSVLNIRDGFDKTLWKKMFSYAFPLLFFGMAGVVNETFDRVLLRYLLPETIAESQIGIYGACYKISILMTIFIQAYKYAAEPFFFSQAKEKDSKQTFSDMMNYFVIAVSFIFLITVLFLDIALLMIGKDFREGREVIPILLLANLFLGIFYNLSIWYKLTNKTRYGAYISVAGAVVTIGLNFVLIPIMGYLGAAWATFICYFFMMLVSFIIGQKHYPIPYSTKKMCFYVLFAISIYFLDLYIDIDNTILLYGCKILEVLTFVLVVYMLEIRKMNKNQTSVK